MLRSGSIIARQILSPGPPAGPAYTCALATFLLLAAGLLLPPSSRADSTSLRLDPAKALTQYHLDRWTTDEGLPQNTVTAILKSRDGYLWLGTQEGLARFDGLRFVVFDKANSNLPYNWVSALHEGRDGTLWIGTLGGGVARMVDGRIFRETPQDGQQGLMVTGLVEDRSGTLWVGTDDRGLGRRLPDGTWVAYAAAKGLPESGIAALHLGRDGTLWVGTRDHGLYQSREGRFESVDMPGVRNVPVLYEDHRGTLWIGTRGDGLLRYDGQERRAYTTEDGLPSDVVLALAEDPSGSLWIGTEHGGVSRLQDGAIASITSESEDGLTHDVVRTLFADGLGSLWIGTDGGGLNRLRDGKFVTYTTREGLAHDFVYTIFESRDGSLWVGTEGGGLSRLRDGAFTTFTTADGLPSDLVFSLFTDRRGTLWIGTGKGLARWQDDRFAVYSRADGLTSDAITALAEGADGTLWVGTYQDGLNALRDGRVAATYGKAEGLLSNMVLTLHVDADGTLWIGTFDGGLHRLRGGEMDAFTTGDGLFSDNILQILEDGAGRLWMTSNKGLFVLSRGDLAAYRPGDARLHPQIYQKSDGLKSQEFNGGVQPAGWRGRDGRLWFPTSRGVAAIDPAHISIDDRPPPIRIEAVIVDDDAMPLGGDLDLPPGNHRVEFRYAGLSFLAPEKTRYRYRLEGSDESWVEAGSRREAFYTNLAPGTYTFHVAARNGDGVWSTEAAQFSFRVRPFFYQTAWFYLLVFLALVALAAAVHGLRVRRLTARQRDLEHLVDERTRDLREAKEQIEEQADRLRELDRIKTRFFNNISHEFRTPLTLNIGPLENALTGFYGPVAGPLRDQLSIMLRNARRLLRLINQLLDLSKLESGKMVLKVSRLNLVPFAEGVVLSFTAFAARKSLDLAFTTTEPEMTAGVDPECLEKVLFNLLSNAIKFTPEEGRIDVRLATTTRPDGRPAVALRVADTGPGIPADELPHIFDRFHQVDGSVSQVQEGTGIGLALVKELVELHGGDIAVESEVGAGTAFTITLPADLYPTAIPVGGDGAATNIARGPMVEMAVFDEEGEADASDDSAGAPAEAPADAPLLLIVDDNPDIRDYMASCLTGLYRLERAVDGRDALKRAGELQPDLIISDVMMPHMDGYELCRAVRADASLTHVPFILLTAKASVDDRIEGLEAGADDYVAKPFNARELQARVRNLLTLREHQQQLYELNDELRVSNASLHELSETKSELLRIAAHDLKNPLSSIQGFAALLREEIGGEGADAAHDEMLGLILESSDKMLQIITQVLESEALESGSIRLERHRTSLGNLAENVVRHNRQQAQHKGQTLHLHVADDTRDAVMVDPTWLQRAMDNLVSNAIKYSPPGRSIWVTVARRGERLGFSVRDEGPGLSESDQAKLFKKFQRLSAIPTGGESSTGLGLSIVKQIVEHHEGQVHVESELGQGSTFTIVLDAPAVDSVPSS